MLGHPVSAKESCPPCSLSSASGRFQKNGYPRVFGAVVTHVFFEITLVLEVCVMPGYFGPIHSNSAGFFSEKVMIALISFTYLQSADKYTQFSLQNARKHAKKKHEKGLRCKEVSDQNIPTAAAQILA